MPTDKSQEDKKIAENIDKKIEKEVAKQVEEQVSQKVEKQVEQQVSKQMEDRVNKKIARSVTKEILKNIQNIDKKLQESPSYKKLIYPVLVIIGVALFGFGTWRVLWRIPVFEDGVIPLVVGALLLLFTGTWYNKLVGSK